MCGVHRGQRTMLTKLFEFEASDASTSRPGKPMQNAFENYFSRAFSFSLVPLKLFMSGARHRIKYRLKRAELPVFKKGLAGARRMNEKDQATPSFRGRLEKADLGIPTFRGIIIAWRGRTPKKRTYVSLQKLIDLLAIVDLEMADVNLFRGYSPKMGSQRCAVGS